MKRIVLVLALTASQAVGTFAAPNRHAQVGDTPAPVTATAPVPIATATPKPIPAPPPRVKSYVRVQPGVRVIEGHTLVPATFLANSLGAAIVPIVANRQWEIIYFHHTVKVAADEKTALLDEKQIELPIAPLVIEGRLYIPWVPLAELFNIAWSRPKTQAASTGSTVLLLQYPGAYIEDIRHSTSRDKVRIVMHLSNATRVTARYTSSGVRLYLSAARRPTVGSTEAVGDYLVPRVSTRSGNWHAQTEVKLNYAAPASWFTVGNPPRIVVDVQKLFEKSESQAVSGGLTLTKIFRGTGHGPVRIFLARIDPEKGWRLRVSPAGYSVLQRQRTSRIASRAKAPLAINGGFFAYDGAAVGAVKVNGEWIRLPWKGRSAIAFDKNGSAKIGNLQVSAQAMFSNGVQLPIRDLNGWPDRNRITALTRRFAKFIRLRSGDIATVVDKNVVTNTPGSGGVNIPAKGFVLVANGGAVDELKKIKRGLRASLTISAPDWDEYPSALGGGPRLVTGGEIDVRNEGFRSDVTQGLGPRTAMGIDNEGRYIIVIADGRQGYYSTGLTLTELAYTLQKHGAVDAINLDGGGSTAMAVRGRVVNRPSDGTERRVSNALLVMR